jgi:hypothetical protein
VDKQRQKYKGLLDMIDGGGAGAVGNEFEGGGLLSVIANAIATPYGSSDRMQGDMQAQRPMARPSGGFGNGSIASTDPASPQLSPLEMFGGQQPAPYSPTVQGSGMTPANNYVPSSMPFDPSAAVEFTMPDGSSINRAAPMQDPYNNSVDNSYQRFTEELFELFGPEVAPSYIGTGAGEMLYNNYVKNGYRFPVN